MFRETPSQTLKEQYWGYKRTQKRGFC
jgi:hypothetical protein